MLGEGTREERGARAAVALGLCYRLPEGGLGRVLALWGFAGVPFFRAFREPAGDGSVTLERRGRDTGVLPDEGRTR